jgi:predicted permease
MRGEYPMGETFKIISKVLPIIILIIFGQVLRRTGYLAETAVAGMKKLTINIALPVVIFISLSNLEFRPEHLILALFVFAISILLLFCGLLVKKATGSQNRYLPALFTGYENGMVGYGVLSVMFGQSNIYPIVILDLGQTLFFAMVFTTYMNYLNGNISAKANLFVSFWKNPFLIASVSAILLKTSGVIAFIKDTAVLECLEMFSAITTPLMCIVIGFELKIDAKRLGKPFAVVVSRLALLLCVAFLFNKFVVTRLLRLDKVFETAVYTMFMLPTFFVGATLIRDEAIEEKRFALNVISIHVIVFLVLFSMMVTANC